MLGLSLPMTLAQIIDGRAAALLVLEEIAQKVAALPRPPCLAVILVGDDPASHVYVRNKIKACERVGITSREYRLEAHSTQHAITALIENLNRDNSVDGILLQLPLPAPLKGDDIVQAIHPDKDVDGLNVLNVGRLVAGQDGLKPCTPQGALHLIRQVEKNLTGLHAVVIGRSLLFGKPMAQLLLAENCTVTTAHSKTKNLPDICREADILVAAVGSPRLVKASWVKDGAVVIDVGINRVDGRLVGDVDYEAIKPIARAITPVPGGVGPMTIAYLMHNTLSAAHKNLLT